MNPESDRDRPARPPRSGPFARAGADVPAGPAGPQPRLPARRCAATEQRITIARPAAEVFAHLADPAHPHDWLLQLRREETDMPDAGLEAHREAGTVRWSFEPAVEWRVHGADGVATLTPRLRRDTAPAADPTGPETPEDAARFSAMAALRSLKSHLEGAGGGPNLRASDAPSSVFGRGAT